MSFLFCLPEAGLHWQYADSKPLTIRDTTAAAGHRTEENRSWQIPPQREGEYTYLASECVGAGTGQGPEQPERAGRYGSGSAHWQGG